jgi:hypothetical protein
VFFVDFMEVIDDSSAILRRKDSKCFQKGDERDLPVMVEDQRELDEDNEASETLLVDFVGFFVFYREVVDAVFLKIIQETGVLKPCRGP